MTRDEAKKLLPIIQAFAEGEEVQVKVFGGWRDLNDAESLTLGSTYEYRIKPKPREVWIVGGGRHVFTSEDAARESGFWTVCSKFREVLD